MARLLPTLPSPARVPHRRPDAGDARRRGRGLLSELTELTENRGLVGGRTTLVKLRDPSPALLLGKGKAEELSAMAKEDGAEVIVFDAALSPASSATGRSSQAWRSFDRQEVILEVFADRAHTREAVLQVALARMEYSLPPPQPGPGPTFPGSEARARWAARRDAAGAGQARRTRPHRPFEGRSWPSRAPARRPAHPACAGARADRLDRGLYQRRQVLAPEHAHRLAGAGRGQALRDPRSDTRQLVLPGNQKLLLTRHGGLHPAAAARAGGRRSRPRSRRCWSPTS